MKDQIVFDTTDANTIADSDHVGSHTLAGDGTLITSGDNDSDNLSTTAIEGLDVRNFNYGYDSVGDNWDRLQQVSGALKVFIDDGDFEVDVVINAEKAEDSAHTTADIGNYVLSVRMDDVDGANAALLAGTEGDYQSLFTNDKGELHVRDNDAVDLLTTIDADTSSIESNISLMTKAEDSVHVSGDSGIMSLAVRNDAGTALAADGDYIPFTTDSSGALYVNVTTPITVDDAALADTSIANAVNTLGVASTAEDVVASPLTNRKYLFIYNNDNRKMFVGATGVTEANGFPISPSSYLELRAGDSIDIEWVSPKVSHEIRTLELS